MDSIKPTGATAEQINSQTPTEINKEENEETSIFDNGILPFGAFDAGIEAGENFSQYFKKKGIDGIIEDLKNGAEDVKNYLKEHPELAVILGGVGGAILYDIIEKTPLDEEQ